MIQIVYLVTDVQVNATDWGASQSVIENINNEIQFYKNLSFKVINLDHSAVTRQDPSASGVSHFPHLRAFNESGKILDNWGINKITQSHWDNWKNKYGEKYTLQELDDLRKSDELRKLEKERKRLEQLELEAKKREEKQNTSKATSNTMLLIGGAIALIFLFKK